MNAVISVDAAPRASIGSAVDPEIEALEDELTTLAGHLNAAGYRFLKLLSEFERRGGYAGWGIVSCAHWLSWKCGLGLVAAREKCRVARALDALPLVSEAMRRGAVSYCKVRAITRVATAENEQSLLAIAEHGTVTHVEKAVRLYRRAQLAQELESANRKHAERALSCYVDDDGCIVIRARLAPEQGAVVRKALAAAAQVLWDAEDASRESPQAELSAPDAPADSYGSRQADALALLAESFLARGAAVQPAAERHLVTVHVDEGVLRGASVGDSADGRCELEDISSVPPATVRRLCCDASLVALVEKADGTPLNVGRKTRVVPTAMQRALVARDVGCRYPGCANTRFTDAHHIVHWADGGETGLHNLMLLCRRHHRYVHEYGFSVERSPDGRQLRFVRPDGRFVPDVPRGIACSSDAGHRALRSAHAQIAIDRSTAVPAWNGDDPDYGMIVQPLCALEARRWCS